MSGRDAQIGWSIETTPGTIVAPTVFAWLADESIDITNERVESAGIITGRRGIASDQWAPGNITVEGDVTFELYNRSFGKIMRAMFGTVNTTGAGPYTHTFTPGNIADDSLTVQVGVPNQAGTAYTKTCGGVGITDWDISFAAGENVVMSASIAAMNGHMGTRTVTDGATTDTDATVTSASAAFSAKDVGKPISGTGIPTGATIASVNSATSIELSAVATATATGLTVVIGTALASASFASGMKPYSFTGGSVTVGGTSVDVISGNLHCDMAAASSRRFVGTPNIKQVIEEGLRTWDGELELEFTDLTEVDRFFDATEFALVLAFESGTDSATFTLNVRYDGGVPMVGGTDIVTQTLPYKGVGDTDAEIITAVIINSDSAA